LILKTKFIFYNVKEKAKMSQSISFEGDEKEFTFTYKGYTLTLDIYDQSYDTSSTPFYQRKFSIGCKDSKIYFEKCASKEKISHKKDFEKVSIEKDKIDFDKDSTTVTKGIKRYEIDGHSYFTVHKIYKKLIITVKDKVILIVGKRSFGFLGFKIFLDPCSLMISDEKYKLFMPFGEQYTAYLTLCSLHERSYRYGFRKFGRTSYEEPHPQFQYFDILTDTEDKIKIEETGFTIEATKSLDSQKFSGKFTFREPILETAVSEIAESSA
jgi:hypothetical protein